MRTTVNIDDRLLAEVKIEASSTHRTIGAVIEEALRDRFEQRGIERPRFAMPVFAPARPGLQPGVDLTDREQMAELLADNAAV